MAKTKYNSKELSSLDNFIPWTNLKSAVLWEKSRENFYRKFDDFLIVKLPDKKLPVDIQFPNGTQKRGIIQETKREMGNPNYTEHTLSFDSDGTVVKVDIKTLPDLKFRISKETRQAVGLMKKIGWL
jgi:hypothetical protein